MKARLDLTSTRITIMAKKKNNTTDIIEVVAKCDKPLDVSEIETMILNFRGVQVMLDSDLAMLYGVETKRLNEQVKRNIERFPEDFMFQLSMDEAKAARSHFATMNMSTASSKSQSVTLVSPANSARSQLRP